jgi:hypothetical protein
MWPICEEDTNLAAKSMLIDIAVLISLTSRRSKEFESMVSRNRVKDLCQDNDFVSGKIEFLDSISQDDFRFSIGVNLRNVSLAMVQLRHTSAVSKALIPASYLLKIRKLRHYE